MEKRVATTVRGVRPMTLVATVVILAMVGLGAWRWMPRPAAHASAEMQTASRALAANGSRGSTAPPAVPVHPRTDRQRLMVAAYSFRGIPYKWGAKGPNRLDCSGFTKAAYAKIGVELPDGSFNQAKDERALSSTSPMKPGDLIFYRWANSSGVNHVTMYAGEGWVIGTGSPGQLGKVTLYPLSADLVDDGRVITYRHIVLADER